MRWVVTGGHRPAECPDTIHRRLERGTGTAEHTDPMRTDPAGRLALVPVGEPGLEPLVGGIVAVLRGPCPAQRGQHRNIRRLGHSDRWIKHGVRAYLPGSALAPWDGTRAG